MKKVGCLFILLILISVPGYAKDYIIGGGDALSISVWGSPELGIETTVRPDGKISLPALGELKASGLTPVELKDLLEKEMKKIVKTPIVTVVVTAMTNYRIFVFGKGAPTGVYPLRRETTLIEFLSQLGPLSDADLESAYLVRNKKKIKLGIYKLFEKGDLTQDVILESNDMLFIPDNFEKRISIIGAVMNPATLPYRAGLTVLDVILSAGGFNEFAKENAVEIYTKKTALVVGIPDAQKSGPASNNDIERVKKYVRAKDLMKGDLSQNMLLMPGDVVVVKESFF